MSTFLEMKQNVGDDVQDDTASMLTRIGRYLNRRQREVAVALSAFNTEDETYEAVDMVDSTDEVSIDEIEEIIECGARSDALKYKRKYAAANQEEMKFQQMLSMYLFKLTNEVGAFVIDPQVYDREALY